MASPICAILSAPVTEYKRAMPVSIRKAAMVLVTAKLNAPWSGAGSSVFRPQSANAAVLMSSKKTKRLKISTVRLKPHIAARKISIRGWKWFEPESTKRQEKIRLSKVKVEASTAKPALIGSATKLMPTTTEPRGNQFPNQYTLGAWITFAISKQETPRVRAANPIPTLSAAARISHLRRQAIRAAPIKGTATGKGVNGEGPVKV